MGPTHKLASIFTIGISMTVTACGEMPVPDDDLEQQQSASIRREIKAIDAGEKFTKIYRHSNGAPAYGHKRHATVPSVLICMDHRLPQMPPLARLQTMMTRTQGYFTASSQGRFQLGNTRFIGCGGNTGTLRTSAARAAGYYDGILRDTLEAAEALPGVDLDTYDTNRDGNLTGDEVVITLLFPQDGTHPRGKNVAGAHRLTAATLGRVRSAEVIDATFQGVNNATDADLIEKFGTMAHEIMHQTFDADDMYDSPLFQADWFSLMDRHFGASHLDPFHKLKLGWLNARAYTYSGAQTFNLRNIETTGDVVVLYDPAIEAREYFIVENRSAGLVLWRIVEETGRLYMNQQWAQAYSGQMAEKLWGRYAIHRVTDGLTAANGGRYRIILTEGRAPFTVREVSRDASGTSTVEVAYTPGN